LRKITFKAVYKKAANVPFNFNQPIERPTMRLLVVIASVSAALAVTTCNVLDYGAVADNSTDVGPALKSAYSSCVAKAVTTKTSDTVLLVPAGSFLLASNVVFSKAKYFTLTITGDLYMPFDSSLEGTMLQWNVRKNIISYL
jgi:rhamnogalacturonan hydrolase